MHRLSVIVILSILLLVACGGSSGGGGGNPTPTNPSVSLSGTPTTCTIGSACNVALTATVTPGTNPTSTGIAVSGDMHSCTGSSSSQAFAGSGTTFTFACTLPSASAGTFTLGPVTATDAQARTSAASGTVGVAVSSGSSGTATPVTVSASATASNINITLPAPGASPALNATSIGAAVPAVSGLTTISLANASAVIHLSSVPTSGPNAGQMIVALLGNGMTTGTPPTSLITSVTLSGPNDITVGTVSSLTAGGGVGFRITLGGSTATGARTVFLKNAQGDITTFTGGLEILP